MLTYFLKIGQKDFNGLILYNFGKNLKQIRQLFQKIYAKPYAVPLNGTKSSNMINGLGLGFR